MLAKKSGFGNHIERPRTTTKPQGTEKLINLKREKLNSHSHSLHSFGEGFVIGFWQ
jgi:hypothetical protein